MVDPLFFTFLKDLHNDNLLVANKYTKNIKWGWMGLNDATWRIFLKSMKNCWHLQKYHIKSGQKHNIRKQQHSIFPMKGYSSKSDKLLRN